MVSQNIAGFTGAGWILVKSVVILSIDIVQLVNLYKHIAEAVWPFIIHKFILKFQAWISNIFSNFDECNCLKTGSVRALYQLFVMIRKTRLAMSYLLHFI